MKTVIFLLLFSWNWLSWGKTTEVTFMTAGYRGYVNVGVGQTYDYWLWNFSYGYTPKNKGGHEITQLHLKADYLFQETNFYEALRPYFTSYLLYNPDSRTYILSPPPYPEQGYYPSTALFVGVGFGGRISLNEHNSVSIETSILSPQLALWYNNQSLDLTKFFSLGIGYQYSF